MSGEPGEWPFYLKWVRIQHCAAHSMSMCSGGVQAHHAGRKPGMSRKAHDSTCIPLCVVHHTMWHAASGPFKTWDKAKRRAWSDRQIAASIASWNAWCRAHWTGPRPGDINGMNELLRAVPPTQWPFGCQLVHEEGCHLHEGGRFCDCAASDQSDDVDQ